MVTSHLSSLALTIIMSINRELAMGYEKVWLRLTVLGVPMGQLGIHRGGIPEVMCGPPDRVCDVVQ